MLYMKNINISHPRKSAPLWLILLLGLLAGGLAYYLLQGRPAVDRTAAVVRWIRGTQKDRGLAIAALERCPDAPFLLPTSGLAGYLWDDSFRPGHRHQGIDIFAGTEPGITPVYAAADGFLTRQADWKSSIILRIPSDPVMPGRQIWLYYTHMADKEGVSFIDPGFPPGSFEIPVKAGQLLGYQGNYSGNPANPVGVHLHFSVVRDDGSGHYLNELEIQNTLDPSPYLGMDLNSKTAGPSIPVCPIAP